MPSLIMRAGETRTTSLATPMGRLIIMADEHDVKQIILPGSAASQGPDLPPVTQQNAGNCPVLARCCRELDEYFRGKRRIFSVPVHPAGTLFQKRIWQLLTRIPFGKTASYGALAGILGNKKAARAVGGAAGKNPLPIIIPCHRLIGQNNSLTGFASGLQNKAWLLRHENNRARI